MTGRDDIPPPDGGDDALAAEYALGLLDAEAARAFEARLAREPDLRAAYARWAEHFAGLTDGIAPVAPPAHLRRRVLGIAPRRPVWRRGWAWAAGAVAAALLVWINAGAPFLPDAEPEFVAEIAAEDRALVLAAAYDADTSQLVVDRQSGQAASGRVLELWLIAGDAAPVSLGVLPDDPRAEIAVPQALRDLLAAGAILAVSDEPPGGSPTGQPTGAVLAVGQITAS